MFLSSFRLRVLPRVLQISRPLPFRALQRLAVQQHHAVVAPSTNGIFSQQQATATTRWFASSATMPDKELKNRLEDFQELFVEARLCIEDCNDSAGTKYFDEEAEAATEAVEEAVAAFKALISDIEDEDQKNRILRGNGLKVEQLKGELEMAIKGGGDHH
ncbi:expressed unknown protein [Seminavis robusta]|uniref:Uncharacterized protein n=1 Tax=Seminavis robusta TaxID=568900 RepID=A0A9N8EHG6_9STRA|nr:expressed unknown protein [Seminavis robusta]|eukprot:Sro958_g224640.1 n/a (160) ;mRNA; f:19692-20171